MERYDCFEVSCTLYLCDEIKSLCIYCFENDNRRGVEILNWFINKVVLDIVNPEGSELTDNYALPYLIDTYPKLVKSLGYEPFIDIHVRTELMSPYTPWQNSYGHFSPRTREQIAYGYFSDLLVKIDTSEDKEGGTLLLNAWKNYITDDKKKKSI